MYDLFIGNYQEVMNGRHVYHKQGKEFIPCVVTNYYFKTRKFSLVPLVDMKTIDVANHRDRRIFQTTKVYIPINS